jgi:hypothetical protein
VVAVACAVGAVLGLSGATLADATLAACGTAQAGETDKAGEAAHGVDKAGEAAPGVDVGQPVSPERAVVITEPAARPVGRPLLGLVCASRPDAAAAPAKHRFTATATRHLPASAGPLPPGVDNPVTDRVMALVIGWAMLALVGGGLFAGRRERVPAGRGGSAGRVARRRDGGRGRGPRAGAPHSGLPGLFGDDWTLSDDRTLRDDWTLSEDWRADRRGRDGSGDGTARPVSGSRT